MIERVLSLDISSKTGFALLLSGPDSYSLEAYGQVRKIAELGRSSYPVSYLDWADACFAPILALIEEHKPDVLVIEETAGGSKSAYSQKILEWIHYLVARHIQETGITSHYFMTEEWRRECGCLMTKEESKSNKTRNKIRKESGAKLARDEKGKIIGKVTRKHVNVRRANEIFGKFLKEPLRMREEDSADALNLSYAYHSRKMKL